MNRDDANKWLIVEKAKREIIDMVAGRAEFYRSINNNDFAEVLMAQIGCVKASLRDAGPLLERIKNGSEPIED